MNKLNKIIIYSLIIFFALNDNAFAWGSGMHIQEGLFILKNLNLFSGSIVGLLSEFPSYYLYGCISADIFIGKGYKQKEGHCHNWSIGKKILENSSSDPEYAFSYGYLSHLAADIIAHNYYIPNQLYTTSSTKRFGHLYWEFRSDSYVKQAYWKIAMDIIKSSNEDMDILMQEIVKKKIIPFNTKKKIFSKAIQMQGLEKWHKTVDFVSKGSRWKVSKEYVHFLHVLSLKLIIDFLKNPESAICFKYDPIGTYHFLLSKKMRRMNKKITGQKPTGELFTIPDEIISLPIGL